MSLISKRKKSTENIVLDATNVSITTSVYCQEIKNFIGNLTLTIVDSEAAVLANYEETKSTTNLEIWLRSQNIRAHKLF